MQVSVQHSPPNYLQSRGWVPLVGNKKKRNWSTPLKFDIFLWLKGHSVENYSLLCQTIFGENLMALCVIMVAYGNCNSGV